MACGVIGVDGAIVALPVAKVVVPEQDCVTTQPLSVVVEIAPVLPYKLTIVKLVKNVTVTVHHCTCYIGL